MTRNNRELRRFLLCVADLSGSYHLFMVRGVEMQAYSFLSGTHSMFSAEHLGIK